VYLFIRDLIKQNKVMEETKEEKFVRLLINQLEEDVGSQDFEALDELLTVFVSINDDKVVGALRDFLTDERCKELDK
jgi:predicted solute-binding protein